MVKVLRNPRLDDALAEALISVWVDVTNAGGAVGFVAPVQDGTVRPLALEAFARVGERRDELVVALEGGRPLAFGFLVPNEHPLMGHWAWIKRLQRHPGQRARGLGRVVLRELEVLARERGFERVCLTVRGGTGRERFYQAQGYTLDGVLPGRLRLAEGVVVDDLHLSKVLDESAPTAGLALQLHRLDPDLPLPRYAHEGDAGLDLYTREDVELAPGERAVVPTGVAVAIPPGCVGLVHPRSGLAARHGVALVNAPGTVDAGYRGEIKVILVNLDVRAPVILQRGDRVAQLVVQRVERVLIEEVAELPPSSRAEGGFGSSGR